MTSPEPAVESSEPFGGYPDTRLTEKVVQRAAVEAPDGTTKLVEQVFEPEPVKLADALNGGAATEAEFLAAWTKAFQRDPEMHHEPGVCRYCSQPVPKPWVVTKGPLMLPITVCEPCVEAGQERHKREQLEAQSRRYSSWVPPEFALPWDAKLGNAPLRAKVMAYAIDMNRNLLIHGDSGYCKTRCVWELLKHLSETVQGFEFHWLDAFEIQTKGIPAEALKSRYLVLDDLGNESLDRKTETALLNLFKKRLEWHKPMFITTQLNGQAFRDRFFPTAKHTATAILRRLKERTDFIAVV